MRNFLAISLSACLVFIFARSSFGECEFPCKKITNIVVWGATGATDSCNRVLSSELSDILGVKIDVINMVGGFSGSLGMKFVMGQPHDGYTLCGISEGCVAARMHDQDVLPMSSWKHFIAATAPIVISVPQDSPHQSLQDLLATAERMPGHVRVATSGIGTAHHLNLQRLETEARVDFDNVIFPGSSPAQEAVLEGLAEAVISALPEQVGLLKTGKVKALAAFSSGPVFGYDSRPIVSVADTVPTFDNPFGVTLGFSVPADIPGDALRKLEDAFAVAIASQDFRKWAFENHYDIMGISGQRADVVYQNMESMFYNLMKYKDANY